MSPRLLSRLGRRSAGTLPTPRRPRDSRRRAIVLLTAGLVLFLFAYVVATIYSAPRTAGNHIRYDEFIADVRAGKIQGATILIADRRIAGSYDAGEYWLDYGQEDISPTYAAIVSALSQASIPTTIDQQWVKSLLSGPQVTAMLPALILIDGLVLTYMLMQGGGLLGFSKSGSRRLRTGESKITFGDVAGVDEALEELAEIRDFLADPQRFLAMGAKVPRGILLIGPPGCGKTLLARAVAGEAEAQFFSISGSEFVEMFQGVGAARIRSLFREAQQSAPSIVFIDELDAAGRARTAGTGTGQEEREATLNQLLVGLDGFDKESGVVVMAATNRPDVLDPALLRPGRFDRRVIVDLPDLAGRRGILKVHVRGKPLAADVDLQVLAQRTPGFSGADLASAVNEGALLAARRGVPEITNGLLWEAVERVIAGPERRSRVLGPDEKRLIAYHESGHALVSTLVNPTHRVRKISLMSRGRGLGLTWYDVVDERHVASRRELCDRLVMMMGGRAAEELLCGDATSTAEDDLLRASELARRMVTELGMSERLGPISLKPTAASLENDGSSQPSSQLASLVDDEVRALLKQALADARARLVENRSWLDRVATRLAEKESLEGDELLALLGGVELAASS